MNFIIKENGLYFSKNNIELQLICDEHNIPYYFDNELQHYYIESDNVFRVLVIVSNMHNISII